MQRQRYGRSPRLPGRKRVFTYTELKAVRHLSQLGATEKEIAEYFDVEVERIQEWKRNHRLFKAAVNQGGLIADMKVAKSLYKRAVGYRYIEEEYSAIEIDGVVQPMEKMCKVKRTIKTVIPDVKAQQHWLKVRRRNEWSSFDVQAVLHGGSVNHLHQKLQDIDIQQLTPESQKMLFEITQQQLASSNSTT